MDQVSCIMTVYNEELYLKESVMSVIEQVNELILINDGSTDSSLKTIKKLVEKYKKLRYISYKRNRGCGFARNLGAKRSKYNLLLFMDSDIILPKKWVEKARIKLQNEIAMIGTFITTEKKSFSQKLMYILRHKNNSEYPKLISGVFLIKKDIFYQLGKFDKEFKYAENIRLCKSIIANGLKIKRLKFKALHLGEPLNFLELLRRQKKYGKNYSKNLNFSIKEIIKTLLFLSPISIFSSLFIFYLIAKYERDFLSDIAFLAKVIIGFPLYISTFYFYFLTKKLRS